MAATIELPDPFLMRGDARVQSADEWGKRRQEILDLVIPLEYGRLPPIPDRTEGEELHHHEVEQLDNARHVQYRIRTGPRKAVSFMLDLLVPPRAPALGVMLNGDGCWRNLTEEITLAVLRRGYILAQFNRVELAADNYRMDRSSGLYAAYPQGDFGAIAAWAWGFHRCVDFLCTLDFVDSRRIAVTGHSRGGKAALLAGATDERISLTAPNGSGCGGAGSFLWQGPKSESLADILKQFPYWFAPKLKEYIGREASLGFDQHFIKALAAPRALLSTEAFGDLWANPTGTWQTHDAGREVYRFLGASDRIGIHYRQGGHEHTLEDWDATLDFADWYFNGIRPGRSFNAQPFDDLPRAFSWSAPGGR
ncbi:MAG: hypothetical protein ABSF77_10910 [Spirochaetia bacterium]|jgi:hypothetical protein